MSESSKAAEPTDTGSGQGAAGATRRGVSRFVTAVFLGLLLASVALIVDYLNDNHRPNPFEEAEAIWSPDWWLHPLPSQAATQVPFPAGERSRFLARSDYLKSHGIEITPGSANAMLGDVGDLKLTELHPFEDGSGWALVSNGRLYATSANESWQTHDIQVAVEKLGPTPAPTIVGEEILTVSSKAPANWAAFSPDGQVIITYSREAGLQGWRSDSGDEIWSLPDVSDMSMAELSFDPANPLLVAPAGSRAFVLDWQIGKTVSTLDAAKDRFSAAAFEPGGSIITWLDGLGLVAWTVNGDALSEIGPVTDPAEEFLFSPNGRFMALGSGIPSTTIFQFPSLFYLVDLPGKPMAFTSQESGMILEREKGGLVLVELGKGAEVRGELEATLLAVNPQNDTLLAQSPKEQLVIWNYGTDTQLTIDGAYATTAAVTTDGALFAIGLADGGVEFIDGSGQPVPGRLSGIGEPLRSLAFSPDGSRLLTAASDGLVVLWDSRRSIPAAVPTTDLESLGSTVRMAHFIDSLYGVLVAEDGRLLETFNGGLSWAEQVIVGSDDTAAFRPNALHLNDPDLGWLVGDAGVVVRSEADRDDNAVWTSVDTPTDKSLQAVHFTNRNIGIAVGESGAILKTEDSGRSWKEIVTDITADLHAVHLQGEVGWIAGAPREDGLPLLYQTTDGGESWQNIDYGELPAPLLLFVSMPLLAFTGLVMVGLWQKPVVVTEGVDPAGTSDRPIGWDDPDPLGFQPIAKGLSSFLRNKDTVPPLTIGINGPWGTGKSSLMNLLKDDLRQYGCNAAWFNAWHHQKEEHLLAALLQNIRKQVVPTLWQPGGLRFRWRLLIRRSLGDIKAICALGLLLAGLYAAYEVLVEGDGLGKLVAFVTTSSDEGSADEKAKAANADPPSTTNESEAEGTTTANTGSGTANADAKAGDNTSDADREGAGSAAAQATASAKKKAKQESGTEKMSSFPFEWLESLQKQGGLLGKIGGALAVVAWVLLRLRVLPSDPAKLMAKLGRRASVRNLREQLGFRTTFATEFRQVCDALRWQGGAGLVILIDDLDRCQPKQVLEILEAVNFLSTAGDCFIILGMARRQVENCVAIEFKEFIVEGIDQEEPSLLRRVNSDKGKAADSEASEDDKEAANWLAVIHGAAWPKADKEEKSEEAKATDNQRRFAEHYLEKMINIELAVPRENPEDSAGLLTSKLGDRRALRRIQWRRRVYGLLGLVYVVLFGAAFGAVGAYFVPPWLAGDQASSQSTVVTTTDQASTTGDDASINGALDDTSNGARSGAGIDESTINGEPEAQIIASPPVSFPQIRSFDLKSQQPWWVWSGPSALLMAILVVMLIRRALRPADQVVRDTPEFTQAITNWYPLIYATNTTPRGIKRFENRMRFLSMQTRPLQPSPDGIDFILNWLEKCIARVLGRKETTTGDEAADESQTTSTIKDDMLVGLGVVEAIDSKILRDKEPEEIHNEVMSRSEKLASHPSLQTLEQGSKYLKDLGKLRQDMSSPVKKWEPTPEDLSEYRRLSGRVRG